MATNNFSSIKASVNGIYPVEYFTLDGTDSLKSTDSLWWSSRQRYAANELGRNTAYLSTHNGGQLTGEYLQIDLDRPRPINYISMSILKAPIKVFIEYDALSTTNGVHNWVRVSPLSGASFDDVITYSAQHRNPWHPAEFYFTDDSGQPIVTQFLRIFFQRRDVDWPIKNATPFRWPILVKSLRTARYSATYGDTIGQLIDSSPNSTSTVVLPTQSGLTTQEVRQRFTMPQNALRATDINPHILGFGVEVAVTVQDISDSTGHGPADLFSLQWSLWDVTSIPFQLKSGIKKNAPTTGNLWIDVFFDPFDPVPTFHLAPRIYELRLSSLNSSAFNAVFTQNAGNLPGVYLSGGNVPNNSGFVVGGEFPSDVTLPELALELENPAFIAADYYTVPSDTLYNFTNNSSTVTTTVDVTQFLSPGDPIQTSDGLNGVYTVQSVGWVLGTTTGTIILTRPFSGPTQSTQAIKPLGLYTHNSTGYQPTFNTSLTMRLWGDVGDSGRDILGNSYRYGTRVDLAANVLDDTQVGWQCEPQPSADAVESMYFDVRTVVNGKPTPVAIDALEIAPRTPGVAMHMYYTNANLNSVNSAGSLRTPQSRAEWDQLLWTPVNVTYKLQNRATLTLPKQIKAAFIKLEFTNLQPQPFKAPQRPSLPPVKFKRYPTWIETQFNNAQVKRAVEDWFVKHRTKVETNILKSITSPILEFQFKEREFLAALALGKVKANNTNQNLIDIRQKALIDPVTGSKIKFQTKDMYKTTLVATVDTSSVLGEMVQARYDPTLPTDTVEGYLQTIPGLAVSSTPNNRVQESFAYIAKTPMWFNQVSRHVYKVDTAEFGSQAYYVGINSVKFLRKDYTVFRDDTLIQDNLTDLDQIDENTFLPDTPSQIANQLFGNDPQTGLIHTTVPCYASYRVNDDTFTDEQVTFTTIDSSIPLQGSGGVAQNMVLTSQPAGAGIQYTYGTDYDLVYSTDPITGDTVNNIQVNTVNLRFVVTRGESNTDVGTVLAISGISADEDYEVFSGVSDTLAGTVTAQAVISAANGYGHPEAGTFTGSFTGTADEVFTPSIHSYTDLATVTGNAGSALSGAEAVIFGDAEVPVAQLTGVGLHLGQPLVDALDTTATYSLYPDVELFSLWVGWKTLQPTSRSSFTWPSALDATIDDAEANGYKVILKVACGADTPSWVYSDPTNPVQSLTAIATDLITGQVTYPVPWDANLLVLYKNLLTKIATQLTGTTSGGNVRADSVYFMPVTMSMETALSGGMEVSYGQAGTYTGSATLASSITGTTTSFTATGANSGAYPTGSFLALCDSELMYVSRAASSDVITVINRGWSGSTATSHAFGATFQYASSVPWTGSFNGNTGPYDVSVQNQAVWLAIGTLASNQANLLTAWQNAVDANISLISIPTGVPSCMSYGQNFGDNWANAQALAQQKSRQYPYTLWHMTGDLQPGNSAGSPTKNGQATYYEGYSLQAGLVVRIIIGNGGLLGFKAARASVYQGFSNPFSGGGSAFETVISDTITNFAPSFVIVDSTILTS